MTFQKGWLANEKFKAGVIGFAVGFTLSFLLLGAPQARADGKPVQEKFLQTDVGYVVITDAACDIQFDSPTPFKWKAYATEVGQPDHEGCWYYDGTPTEKTKGGAVAIFFPEINAVATYNPALFKDSKESF